MATALVSAVIAEVAPAWVSMEMLLAVPFACEENLAAVPPLMPLPLAELPTLTVNEGKELRKLIFSVPPAFSITAIATAVATLGSAQAAVGKGENQLNYATSLAQSQITNFSAAESQIRDANVAAEAANLSKAQVLQQSTIAAMAQANSAPQAVLALLKG